MNARETPVTRRAFLAAVAAVPAACTGRSRAHVAARDAAAVTSAREAEVQLIAGYAPGTPGHAAHVAHLRALGGTLPSASPSASPSSEASSPPAPGPAPVASERASVPVLQAAAVTAHDGTVAAVLASIAASHAVLAGVQPA